MSRQVFRNNVFTKLAGAITDSQTVFAVADGSVIYSPGANEVSYITLQSKNIRSQVEVVQLLSVAGNNVTVVRGVEGAQYSFSANDIVEQRVTAGSLDNFLQTEDVTTSDIAPVTPRKNQRWVDDTDGVEYFWYDNGVSQQWVEIGTQVYGTDPAPPPAVTAHDMYQDQQIALLAADILTLGGADVVAAAYNAGTKNLTITKADSSTVVCSLAAVDADKLDGQEGSYFEGRDTTAIGAVGNTVTLTRSAGNLQVILSALDADTLDGQHGAFYQDAGNMNAGTLPTARLSGSYPITVNAAGDADTLDGQHGAFYQDAGNLNAGTVPTARISSASASAQGIIELATDTEIVAGTAGVLAVTPADWFAAKVLKNANRPGVALSGYVEDVAASGVAVVTQLVTYGGLPIGGPGGPPNFLLIGSASEWVYSVVWPVAFSARCWGAMVITERATGVAPFPWIITAVEAISTTGCTLLVKSMRTSGASTAVRFRIIAIGH